MTAIKKLIIVRHGKSSWDSIMNDIDRPLTERGVKNSYEVAEKLEKKGHVPSVIYTSSANRALHTAIIMARFWELPDDLIRIKRSLYLPEEEDVFMLLSELPDDLDSVAIFGHNPAFTYLVNRFAGNTIEHLPTAGAVVVSLKLDSWHEMPNADILDVSFDFPKKSGR